MRTVNFMGREITISGLGTEAEPFLVVGTGYNPALAAEFEIYMVSQLFSEQPWHVPRTRLETPDPRRVCAVVTVRFIGDDDELLQADLWFDVTEAMQSD